VRPHAQLRRGLRLEGGHEHGGAARGRRRGDRARGTPRAHAAQAANVVQRTAQSLGDRQQFGSGMLDVAAAVR
jgi:hypothetical protein